MTNTLTHVSIYKMHGTQRTYESIDIRFECQENADHFIVLTRDRVCEWSLRDHPSVT